MRVKQRIDNAELWRNLWRLVFPINCVGCGEESDWLCRQCLPRLSTTPVDLCRLCGKWGVNGICVKCQKTTRLQAIFSQYSYRHEAVRSLIAYLKYDGLTDALRFWEEQLFNERVLPLEKAVICPIALSGNRLRERGFNQAELIAGLVARATGWEIISLLRRLPTPHHQVELTKKERLQNVKGQFLVRQGISLPESVILVDDVVTTGATLTEAAKVLRQSGVRQVTAFTLAHG